MNEITNRIKEILKEKGLTQSEVARKMGMMPQTFSDKLNRHGNFTINFLISFDEAVNGIDYNFLFKGTQFCVDNDKDIIINSLIEKIKRLEGKFNGTEYSRQVA